MPLYQEVTEFTPALNPDFGSASFPAFELDSGIVAGTLGADGAPQYARADGNTSTTSGEPLASSALRCCAVLSTPWPAASLSPATRQAAET